MFTTALVRPPGTSYAEGLTAASLGAPDLALALAQHERYCAALEECGLRLIRLPAEDDFPDATFVEDTAILAGRCAVITHPGAPSRRGEVASVRATLAPLFPALSAIEAPGTVDGGDICQIEDHFLIGVTARTNAEGARQLGAILEGAGYTASAIDIRAVPGLLHLKTGLSYLGDGRVAVAAALAAHPELRRYEQVLVAPAEEYAANCIRVNDAVIIAAGFPQFAAALADLGYSTIALEMSEFQKMDGGLSCLSLRF